MFERVTPQLKERFAADGVVKVPRAVGDEWVELILRHAERQLRRPGPWISDTNPGATTNRMFTSRYLWRHHDDLREFVFCSPIAAIAAGLMGSPSVRFYCDHLMVKEPRTSAPTPWHQDIGYWPFLGHQIASAWVSASHCTTGESSLEFVRGSHRWNKYYAPESFDGTDGGWLSEFEGETVPHIDAVRSDADCPYDIVGFDVEPGDAIFFSAWILHGAPGNAGDARRVALATRWLGTDATWFPHPGSDPSVTQAGTTAVAGEYPADDEVFPVVHAG